MTSFKEFENQAWEKKALLYENSWGKVARQAIDEILKLANLQSGLKLLDIGCGDGQLCNAASKTGAEVIGCDYSLEMLKIASNNFSKLKFVRGDAEKLNFEDNFFDVITLNYLLLHVADQKKVLLEAKRVLKTGGKLIFTLWLPPAQSAALKLVFDSIKLFADTSVIPAADDIFNFSSPKNAAEFFKESGFSDYVSQIVETSWAVDSKESFFTAVLAGTRMGGTIDLQEASIKEKIKDFIFDELVNFKTPAGYVVPMPSLISVATKAVA